MKDALDILKGLINAITVVLVAFSMISIIVSSLMILILTNNRVMERVKEIGILRGIGANNKDISRLFNIENFIIGVISSVMGIISIILLKKPINVLMESILEGEEIFNIHINFVIVGVILNIFIVVLSGWIPTLKASKKNVVDCIYGRI